MLEKEYELELIKKAQSGSESAKSILYTHHEKFIRSFVKNYHSYGGGISNEDLFQHALIGFLDSIDKYKLSSEARLSTYSKHRMRSEIFNYLNTQQKGLKIFTTKGMKKVFSNLGKYRRSGDYITLQEAKLMSKELDVSLKEIFEVEKRLCLKAASYELDSDDEVCLADVLTKSDDGEDNPENIIASDQYSLCINEELKRVIDELDSRKKSIILKRFFVKDKNKKSLKEISEEFGVSFQRIKQLEVEAIKKMKENLISGGLLIN
jgi:RNA polymerase sigma-32 factor